jgi:oxygen-independent coproporphyrinogen-3 oxidase
MKPLSVYVHIPFCASKCAYCDFLSFCGESGHDDYIGALCREICANAARFTGYTVRTVYFGGGTPTVLSPSGIKKIFGAITDNYRICTDVEATIEANPESADLPKLAALREIGFNRVSLGVQSWDDEYLRRLGRAHDAKQAEGAIQAAREAGFGNIGVDLMFALPRQAMDGWRETVRRTIGFSPEHVSCYGLTVEDGTPLSREVDLCQPDDGAERDMYFAARDELTKAGYRHYEISNYAKPGFESRHNSNYWTTESDYAGFGLGAASYVNYRRYHNTRDLEEYKTSGLINGLTGLNPQDLVRRDLIEEFIILGLRMTEGISVDEFKRRFGADFFEMYAIQTEKQIRQGLALSENGRYRLTDDGIYVSNKILSEFL